MENYLHGKDAAVRVQVLAKATSQQQHPRQGAGGRDGGFALATPTNIFHLQLLFLCPIFTQFNLYHLYVSWKTVLFVHTNKHQAPNPTYTQAKDSL